MKQPVLSTSALALHDLGLAAAFGGALFAKASLNPAVKVLQDRRERNEVIDAAWDGQRWIQGASIAAVALTWLAGRSAISGRVLGRSARAVTIAKDIALGTAVATGVANMALGRKLGRDNAPIETGNQPSPETPRDDAATQTALRTLSVVNLAALGATIGLSAWLYYRAMGNARWAALAKFLP